MDKREALAFLLKAGVGGWDMLHDSLFLTTEDCDKIFQIRHRIQQAHDVLAGGVLEPEQLTFDVEGD